MALQLSDALRNHIGAYGSLRQALAGGRLKIYSGAQPANANAAPTGTLGVTITSASGANTAEVRATGTVTLNSGAGGSITSITVASDEILGATVPYNTSLTQTAADLAAAINAHVHHPAYIATSSGAVVTIMAPPGSGTSLNGDAVVTTLTTMTKTDVNIGSAAAGVAQVNGLFLGAPAAGVVGKTSAVWSGVIATGITAGWFRFEAAEVDSGALDSAARYLRLDGNCATSGANLNLTSTTLTAAATETINTFTVTIPAS